MLTNNATRPDTYYNVNDKSNSFSYSYFTAVNGPMLIVDLYITVYCDIFEMTCRMFDKLPNDGGQSNRKLFTIFGKRKI